MEHEAMTADTTRPRSRASRLWPIVRRIGIIVFVAWHLTVLALRNTVGLLDGSIGERTTVEAAYQRLNRGMRWYESRFAMYQGWALFTSPVARSGPFLTTRLHFSDGTVVDLASDNEVDPHSFFRVGLMRLRKHEDFLATSNEENRLGYQRALWEQYVRWKLDRWRRQFPDDQRTLMRMTLVVDRVYFPAPNEVANDFSRERTQIARFGPDGTLQP